MLEAHIREQCLVINNYVSKSKNITINLLHNYFTYRTKICGRVTKPQTQRTPNLEFSTTKLQLKDSFNTMTYNYLQNLTEV